LELSGDDFHDFQVFMPCFHTPSQYWFVMHRPFGCASKASQIRVYDATGNVIETHEHKGEFKEW
jgi:hypothetical protein